MDLLIEGAASPSGKADYTRRVAPGFIELLDFIADNPGLTLFHCHQQLHMDFGFVALFKYA